MIRTLWRWLTRCSPAPKAATSYDPKTDPLVRHFRREKLEAQRATQRIERRRRCNIVEAEYLKRRKGPRDA